MISLRDITRDRIREGLCVATLTLEFSLTHTQHATNSTWLDKGAGILTRFPFDGREAGYESPGLGGARRFPLVILGPPYPQLTAISVEPFPTSVLNNSVE